MAQLNIIEEKVKYALTINQEFENSIKLLSGEKIEFKEECRPGIVTITNKRFIFLRHNLLSPDKIVYVPFEKVNRFSINKRFFMDDTILKISYDNKSLKFGFNNIVQTFLGWGGMDFKGNKKFFDLISKKLPKNKLLDNVSV